jgi:FAD/FMN-containing dehydrogenase
MTDSSTSALMVELREIVGEAGLLLGSDAALRSCDPFRHVPPERGVIVRPATTEELSAVMGCCSRRRQRVVTQGGRTGVSGGAYAGRDEIVVSLERMSRVEELDPINQVAIAQGGVPLETLQNAAAEQGLFYPVDLGAKGSATIGGTLATNAGGNRVIRWGMTRANVLGLEAVLADGTVVSSMNRMLKNNTGYDLPQILVGSEGTLGIITRAVLRLVPKPLTQMVGFLAVPHFSALLELLRRARQLSTLSAFEVMWRDYYELMANSGTGRRPVVPDQPFYLLVEAMGYNESLDGPPFQEFLERAYSDGLAADAVAAQASRQIDELWRVREGSEVIVRAMSPFLAFDVSVDVRRAADFVAEVHDALSSRYPALRTTTLGHLGDNNLHLGVHTGTDTLEQAPAIEQIVYEHVRQLGGALTAEHGVGQFKRRYFSQHVSPGALEMMRRIRDSVDPLRLLNRDVLF